MNGKQIGTWALVFTIALGMAMAAGLLRAQEPSVDEEVTAQTDVSAAAPVGLSISVQGRLTDASGNPISGNHTIDARLYNAATGGSLQCNRSASIPVNDGYFSMTIDNCTTDDLNGKQLYLEIRVDGETLTPREPVRVVPYAATLRPGAHIGGSDAGNGSLYLFDSLNRQTISLVGGAGGLYLGTSGQDGDLVVRNSGGSSTFSVDGGSGNVTQVRTGFGLAKAAVYAQCAMGSTTVYRSFPTTGVSVSGTGTGFCTLTFPFQVNDRFYTATAHGTDTANTRIVNCAWVGTNDRQLACRRSNAAGSGVDGDIMVVIY